MLVDLEGRVKNTKLPLSRPLLPLFEAVVNSIHAIEERGRTDGQLEIVVRRESPQKVVSDDFVQPITGFVVRDNGAGFTDENFESFLTSDSTFKQAKGGKGVGRFLWLKAFESVLVESTFEAGGTTRKRTFDFRLSSEGVENHKLAEGTAAEVRTSVELRDFKERYSKRAPLRAEVVARQLLQHCLVYLLAPQCPCMVLLDGEERLDLGTMFKDDITTFSERREFRIKDATFEAVHMRLHRASDAGHRVHYCAHNREVLEERLSKYIPELDRSLADDDGESFNLASYVSGALLDDAVTSERTGFDFSDVEQELFPEEITRSDLRQGVAEEVRAFLKPHLDRIQAEKLARIERYVQREAPQYRPLVKHAKSYLETIPPSVSDANLDIELHKAKSRAIADLKSDGSKFFSESGVPADSQEFYKKYRRLAEQLNDFAKSELAQYIVHRKAILELLRRGLEVQANGKYGLEEGVHELIFPLRSSSDDVSYENQNLWILDEKLAYHRYLSSDKSFASVDVVDSKEQTRPDLVIFNSPFAFVEDEKPFGSVVLVEFKRPQRDNYKADENPLAQLYGYAREISEGGANDRKGRPITIAETTPFYGYVVCDITKKMKRFAEDGNLTPTPDGLGYFGYNQAHRMYVEVISYDKLVKDAQKRNRALFEKLGLS